MSLRWPERLYQGYRISENYAIYSLPMEKQKLLLSKGMTEVAYKTKKSFRKYLEMWKFHCFSKIQFFLQRPKLMRGVGQTDNVSDTKKYTNV